MNINEIRTTKARRTTQSNKIIQSCVPEYQCFVYVRYNIGNQYVFQTNFSWTLEVVSVENLLTLTLPSSLKYNDITINCWEESNKKNLQIIKTVPFSSRWVSLLTGACVVLHKPPRATGCRFDAILKLVLATMCARTHSYSQHYLEHAHKRYL